MTATKIIARKRMEQETTYTFKVKKMNSFEFGIMFDCAKNIHHLDKESHAHEILKQNDVIIAMNGIKCNTYRDILILAKYTSDSALFSIHRDLST